MKTITVEIAELQQLIADAVSIGVARALRADLQLASANVQPGSYIARRTAALQKAELKRAAKESKAQLKNNINYS